jgi:hypothetical protein
MRYGFTGTRKGMTVPQMAAFEKFISEIGDFSEFHHGDCVGADDEAAWMIRDMIENSDMDMRGIKIICHPPMDASLRACTANWDEIREMQTHFARNRAIVDESDVLFVAPCQMERQTNGGTWYTHDYAKNKGKKIVTFWPNGTTSIERTMPA